MMKKNYESPTLEVVELKTMSLLAGSTATETPDDFLEEIQDEILIDSPLKIL